MKTYPYIVINKGDMTKLEHFKTAHQVAMRIFPRTNNNITDNFIVIKDENRVVDLTEIKYYTADSSLVYVRLGTIIDEA
jgi:hypothetical protein